MSMDCLEYKGDNTVSLFKSNCLVCEIQNYNQKELLVNGLLKAIENSCFVLNINGFSEKINNLIDHCYGRSFAFRFKYADLNRQKYVEEVIKNFNLEKSNNSPIDTCLSILLAAFHDIKHSDAICVFVENLNAEKELESEDMEICLAGSHMSTWKANQKRKQSADSLITEKFSKPEISFFTDASVKGKTFCAGYGVSNETINVSFRFEEKTKDNNIAEMISIKNAMLIAKSMGLKTLEVYTDSVVAINSLRSDRILKPNYENWLWKLKIF